MKLSALPGPVRLRHALFAVSVAASTMQNIGISISRTRPYAHFIADKDGRYEYSATVVNFRDQMAQTPVRTLVAGE